MSTCVFRLAALGSLFLTACALHAADWPQWRGPNRNGVAPDSPPLADAWPKTGPKKLWERTDLATLKKTESGHGCVSVAGGRAFIYLSDNYREPIIVRKLTEEALRRLGWPKDKPPEELLKAIEQARTCQERQNAEDPRDPKKLEEWIAKWQAEHPTGKFERGIVLREWIAKWVDSHLDADQKKKFGAWASERINRGAERALAIDVLDKLGTIKDQELADQAALDKWLADNEIPAPVAAEVNKLIPKEKDLANDTVVCLDAATGQTIWQKKFPGKWGRSSSTVTVADGRVYAAGAAGGVYCLDAKDGRQVWVDVPEKPGGEINSSFAVLDTTAVLQGGGLRAWDAASGSKLWSQKQVGGSESSPAVWKTDDKTLLLAQAGAAILAVDPKSSDVVWKAPGVSGGSSPVLAGEYLVVTGQPDKKDPGLTCYKLSADKPAEKVWAVEGWSEKYSSALVYQGHVYAFSPGRAVCVELATGKIAWDDAPPAPSTAPAPEARPARGSAAREGPARVGQATCVSPILADGKIFTYGRGGLVMVKATPEKLQILGTTPLPGGTYSSPAFADGKLFVRTNDAVLCFDLTAEANPPAVQPEAPAQP